MAGKKLKSPYRKGYLKELEVMRILRSSGKFPVVFRCVASHSPFDIVAVSKSKFSSYRLRLEDSALRENWLS
jgi:hypothetical protein